MYVNIDTNGPFWLEYNRFIVSQWEDTRKSVYLTEIVLPNNKLKLRGTFIIILIYHNDIEHILQIHNYIITTYKKFIRTRVHLKKYINKTNTPQDDSIFITLIRSNVLLTEIKVGKWTRNLAVFKKICDIKKYIYDILMLTTFFIVITI